MSANWNKLDKAICNLAPNKIAIYLNVFRPFMKDRIGGNVYRSLAITKENSRSRMSDMKINQQLMEPN